MKTLALMAILTAILAAGCTFHRDGSQAVDFNPFNIGSSDPALSPAAAGGPNSSPGEPWHMR